MALTERLNGHPAENEERTTDQEEVENYREDGVNHDPHIRSVVSALYERMFALSTQMFWSATPPVAVSCSPIVDWQVHGRFIKFSSSPHHPLALVR